MSRLMAIDYGQKRVGIAVSDPLQIIATGLITVHSKNIFTFLDNYFAKEDVELIVVGQAKHLNNTASESMRFIQPFFNKLQQRYSQIKCTFYDERFTSKMALQTMIDGGSKKTNRQKKETLDMISATILLQDYMNFKKNNFK